jgi:hypothetical protein
MEEDQFEIIAIIVSSISILASSGLLFSLNRMKSNYAKTMRHIIIGECIFIFSELMIIIDRQTDTYNKTLCNILSFFLFKLYDYDDCHIIKKCNYACFFAMQAFSIWLSVFICFEMILILKNPIAQMKNRFRKYYLSAVVIGIIQLSISLTYTPDSYSRVLLISNATIPM